MDNSGAILQRGTTFLWAHTGQFRRPAATRRKLTVIFISRCIFCGYFAAKDGPDTLFFLFLFGNEGHIHSGLKRRTIYNLLKNNHFQLEHLLSFFCLLLRPNSFLCDTRTMADNKHPHVIFCSDSPKRVLVSVIKTTPIKPRKAEALTPTSPGFSDFMVYPWKWGENAHNVTLSPGSVSGASSPTGTQTAGEADTAPSPDQLRVSLHVVEYKTECIKS